MAIMKMLLEMMGNVQQIVVHSDLSKSNGLSKKSSIKMHYHKLVQIFGEPIVLDGNSDGKFNWCITVVTTDDEFPCVIYSNTNYEADTPIQEVEYWSIATKSNLQAWQVEGILKTPEDIPIHHE